MEVIRKNLGSLTVQNNIDILSSNFSLKEFNKLYLSNIFNWLGNNIQDPFWELRKFFNRLDFGATVYLTSFPHLITDKEGSFDVDYVSSDRARNFENYWNPIVLKKK